MQLANAYLRAFQLSATAERIAFGFLYATNQLDASDYALRLFRFVAKAIWETK